MSSPQQWDRQVDVVVLGSGAAGLAAATLRARRRRRRAARRESRPGRRHDGRVGRDALGPVEPPHGRCRCDGLPRGGAHLHPPSHARPRARSRARRALRRHRARRDRVPRGEDARCASTHRRRSTTTSRASPAASRPGRSIEPVPYDARTELGEWAASRPHQPAPRRGSRWRRAPSTSAVTSRPTST